MASSIARIVPVSEIREEAESGTGPPGRQYRGLDNAETFFGEFLIIIIVYILTQSPGLINSGPYFRLVDAKSEVGRYEHLRLHDRRLFDASPEPNDAMSASVESCG